MIGGNDFGRQEEETGCIVAGARGSEGTLPKFSDCKGDSERIVLATFVNVAL